MIRRMDTLVKIIQSQNRKEKKEARPVYTAVTGTFSELGNYSHCPYLLSVWPSGEVGEGGHP